MNCFLKHSRLGSGVKGWVEENHRKHYIPLDLKTMNKSLCEGNTFHQIKNLHELISFSITFPNPFHPIIVLIQTNNSIEYLRHIHSIQRIAQFSIIMSRSHSRNHRNFIRKMLLSRDPLCFLHQKRSISFMLELWGASRVHRNRRSVHVQFSHNTHIPFQFFAEHVRSVLTFALLRLPDLS